LAAGKGGGDNHFVLKGVEFQTGSSDIPQQGEKQISELAATLQRHPNAHVRIEGHTDTTGSKEQNQELAEARASAVRDDLIQHGIAADRIETAGLADEHPLGNNDTAEGRAQNRRIEVVVLSP
jgi:OOP family OmpA-OmpF porin